MKPLRILLTALCAIVMQPAGAWSNHTLVAYRDEGQPAEALVRMPLKDLLTQLDPAHFATACRRIAEAARQPDLLIPETAA